MDRFDDVPLAMETCQPLSRGHAGVTGQVLPCPTLTVAGERYHDHLNPEARVRSPAQWWKAEFFITRLLALVGMLKVAALLAVLRYKQDVCLVARQVGVTVWTLRAWEAEVVTIVKEQLWSEWKASRRAAAPARCAG